MGDLMDDAGGGGGGGGFHGDPSAARAEYERLLSDQEFGAKYANGDKAAVARVHQLQEIISQSSEASGDTVLR